MLKGSVGTEGSKGNAGAGSCFPWWIHAAPVKWWLGRAGMDRQDLENGVTFICFSERKSKF